MTIGVILAGGLGTRLRPLTWEIPKALIPVQGKTLTEHVIDKLKEAGADTVYLSIGYKKDQIMEKFGEEYKGVRVKYLVEEEALGTGGFLKLMERVGEDFIVVNGDNLFDVDWSKMFEFHKKSGSVVTIGLTSVNDVSHYGVADIEEGRINKFVEKPNKEEAPSNLINGGYYIFSPSVFEYLPSKDKFMLESDVFPVLAREGKLYGYHDEGQWFDTGTFERWEEVISNWRK